MEQKSIAELFGKIDKIVIRNKDSYKDPMAQYGSRDTEYIVGYLVDVVRAQQIQIEEQGKRIQSLEQWKYGLGYKTK
jgi:hypothetical protein